MRKFKMNSLIFQLSIIFALIIAIQSFVYYIRDYSDQYHHLISYLSHRKVDKLKTLIEYKIETEKIRITSLLKAYNPSVISKPKIEFNEDTLPLYNDLFIHELGVDLVITFGPNHDAIHSFNYTSVKDLLQPVFLSYDFKDLDNPDPSKLNVIYEKLTDEYYITVISRVQWYNNDDKLRGYVCIGMSLNKLIRNLLPNNLQYMFAFKNKPFIGNDVRVKSQFVNSYIDDLFNVQISSLNKHVHSLDEEENLYTHDVEKTKSVLHHEHTPDTDYYFIKVPVETLDMNLIISDGSSHLEKINTFNRTNRLIFVMISMLFFIPILIIITVLVIRPIRILQKRINKHIKVTTDKYDKQVQIPNTGNELTILLESYDILFNLINDKIKDLHSNDDKMASVIDSIDIGIIEIHGKNKKILNINTYAANTLGVTKEEVLNKKCYEVLCNKSERNCDECFLVKASDKNKQSESLLFNKQLKKSIPIIRNAIQIRVNGSFNIVESFINVSDTKKREKELEIAISKADRATVAKSILMGNVSHDMGNLLAGVKGGAEKLYKRAEQEEEYYKILDLLINDINLMSNSVNLMRERTMLETGRSKLQELPVNILELIETIYSSLYDRAISKGIEFKLYTDCTLNKCIVAADANKLEAVLTNLISNAIKFTGKGHVSINALIINSNILSMTIRFEIIDTGIGISEDAQESIFEMYEQANEHIQSQFGGFGQGLTICQNYINMMGGDIKFESILGEGSTFFFELTFNKVPTTETILGLNVDGQLDVIPLNILAADDSATIQLVIEDKLEELGHNFKIVSNGEELIEEYNNGDYDLILADIRMPKKGGIEAVKELRAAKCTIPIIALTANFSEVEQEEYFESGFNACIGKPIDIKELQLIINKVMV
jgi:signal transduction histidine kinase/CheY-like chemotaxis protein